MVWISGKEKNTLPDIFLLTKSTIVLYTKKVKENFIEVGAKPREMSSDNNLIKREPDENSGRSRHCDSWLKAISHWKKILGRRF